METACVVTDGRHRGMFMQVRFLQRREVITTTKGEKMSPVYQYKCDGCGWSIDINRSIAERDSAPMCGDCLKPMARTMTPVAAVFKGSGWGGNK